MDLIVYKAIVENLNYRVNEVTETIMESIYQQPCSGGTVLWMEWKDTLPHTPGHIHAHLRYCKYCGEPGMDDGLPEVCCDIDAHCKDKEDWRGDRYIIDFPAQYLQMSYVEIIQSEQERMRRDLPDPIYTDMEQVDPASALLYRHMEKSGHV